MDTMHDKSKLARATYREQAMPDRCETCDHFIAEVGPLNTCCRDDSIDPGHEGVCDVWESEDG